MVSNPTEIGAQKSLARSRSSQYNPQANANYQRMMSARLADRTWQTKNAMSKDNPLGGA